MPFFLNRTCSRGLGALFLFVLVTMGQGCARTSKKPVDLTTPIVTPALTGYTIQVGAFRDLDNALALTRSLVERGIKAYYFRTKQCLIKVRFGDFPTLVEAQRNAGRLVRSGLIDDYYVIPPSTGALSLLNKKPLKSALRKKIVETARGFIGLPYQWGGASPDKGFDCSGLVMAVYYLNGINLPRTSREQYCVGKPLPIYKLAGGDLVFFHTAGGNRVSHVGIYVGNGKFIHAPRSGKTVRRDSLSNDYYASHYKGARDCL